MIKNTSNFILFVCPIPEMQKVFLVLQACNFFLYPAAWNQS